MAANDNGYKSADDFGSAGLGGERRHRGFVGPASGDALDFRRGLARDLRVGLGRGAAQGGGEDKGAEGQAGFLISSRHVSVVCTRQRRDLRHGTLAS